MLKITDLSVYYGMVCALDGVSIEMPERAICSIVGANGAGKSSLLRSIMGLVKPRSGSISFEGMELTGREVHNIVREGVVLCPEGRKIFKSATVLDNLMAGAYTCRDNDKVQANLDRVFSLFPRLKERAKQMGGTLSGGEQQMLAIGRGLMAGPRLFLLDEPSMGLAPNLVDMVFETIVGIFEQENIPILLVEQNAEMSLSIAKYAYVLEVGKVVISGTGADLLGSDEVREKYLGA